MADDGLDGGVSKRDGSLLQAKGLLLLDFIEVGVDALGQFVVLGVHSADFGHVILHLILGNLLCGLLLCL